MTKTKKSSHIVSVAVFMLVCFATATYADSFVDEGTMNSLKNFSFGQTVSSADRTVNTEVKSNQSDSFVSGETMKSLENFQFGLSDASNYTMTAKTEDAIDAGDSFVSVGALKQLESVRTLHLSLLL